MNYHAFKSLRSPAENFPMCATCGLRPQSKVHVEMTTPNLHHEPLKSLSEVQSEIEDPQCGCGTYLDDDDLPVGACKDCVEAGRRAARRAEEAEFGVDDPYYGSGRGMPR